jgi:hypothetical protein
MAKKEENKNIGLKDMAKSKSNYYLDIDDKISKKLEKLGKSRPDLFKRIDRKIKGLEKYPFPKAKYILYVKGNVLYCELGVDKIRVYYVIYKEKIVICDVTYDGKAIITGVEFNHKSGSKDYPRQRSYIKKEIKKVEEGIKTERFKFK